jgi:N-formylglutamate amidohydrolase
MPHAECHSISSELAVPYQITHPVAQAAPFVWCSPHSGRIYPKAFLASVRLDPLALRKSEDCYVDELISDVAKLGVPLLCAHFPRAYLDVNREPYELDPELFNEPLPDFANTQSARVIGGIGTIPRIVADGEDIYAQPIDLAAAYARIDKLYKPYHAALADLLDQTYRQFGYAILIDCHSMPSALMANHGTARPDIVLGDRFGASCHPSLTGLVKDALTASGYDVQLNRPYAGGYITEHYGRPLRGVHALQLEINRGLYLDERALTRTTGYDRLKLDLWKLAQRLVTDLPNFASSRAAAE